MPYPNYGTAANSPLANQQQNFASKDSPAPQPQLTSSIHLAYENLGHCFNAAYRVANILQGSQPEEANKIELAFEEMSLVQKSQRVNELILRTLAQLNRIEASF